MYISDVITARNITKSYGKVEVLRGVNFSVEEPKIISIVGKSGSGKSTFLHLLGTLDTPDGGSLSILDKDVLSYNENQLAEVRNKEIGFIFQFHHLLAEFTALENVSIPYYINNKSKEKAETRAKELLDYMDLGHRLDHKPKELSGGEQQRVAVARALMNQPKILLADEPTGNLDSQSSENLLEIFKKLHTDFGQTIIMVTHNNELAQRCDISYRMEDGILK